MWVILPGPPREGNRQQCEQSEERRQQERTGEGVRGGPLELVLEPGKHRLVPVALDRVDRERLEGRL
jgi:hypothetical protein